MSETTQEPAPVAPTSKAGIPAAKTGMSLAWLADAPMFIDREQVGAFYDAVVRPEGRRGKVTLSLSRYEGQKTSVEGSAEGEISLSKLITTLLPFLDVKVTAKAGVAHERSSSDTKEETIELLPIDTPQRQLVQLTLHYLTNLPERIWIVTDPAKPDWRSETFIEGLPRALVFVDFPDKTKFIPMAAEVAAGQVVTIFDRLTRPSGERPPAYPGSADPAAKAEYWKWFTDNFSSGRATKAVEDVIHEGGGRVEWIAYRVPIPGASIPLHLTICGRGEYHTGVFAYDLIKRGYSHGLRMVGTLKSEPDMNVLAMFEK